MGPVRILIDFTEGPTDELEIVEVVRNGEESTLSRVVANIPPSRHFSYEKDLPFSTSFEITGVTR